MHFVCNNNGGLWQRPVTLIGGSQLGVEGEGVGGQIKLQALVYDILPSTTAVFSYAIGSRKLSANEQFLVGAQKY